MSSRRLLILCLLVLFMSEHHTTHGYSVKGEVIHTRHRYHGNRTTRELICITEDYYPVSSHLCCKKCPAGTHVIEHCQTHLGDARCKPCVEGEEYTEGVNGVKECLPCTTCREDQEQVSPCTTQRNTVCECRAGTFCAPDQTCEMCQKCKTRCQYGQIMTNCTPTSDVMCRKTEPETGAHMGELTQVVVAVVLPVLIGVSFIILVCFFKRKQLNGIFQKIKGCMHRKDSTDSENEAMQRESSEVVNIIPCAEGTALDTSSHTTDTNNEQAQTERVNLLRNHPEASAGHRARHSAKHHSHVLPIDQGDDSLGQNGLTGPSDSASAFTSDPQHNCGTVGSETRGVDSTEDSSRHTHRASSSVPYKDLVAGRHHCIDKESKDKEDLRHHFMLFIEEVPIRRWKQFMRRLSLTENEIDAADQNNSNDIQEAHYQMLNTWLQKMGKGASIDILLNALREMDLNDTVYNIKKLAVR